MREKFTQINSKSIQRKKKREEEMENGRREGEDEVAPVNRAGKIEVKSPEFCIIGLLPKLVIFLYHGVIVNRDGP